MWAYDVFSFSRAQASELWVKGEKVTCGYISEDTRVRAVVKADADMHRQHPIHVTEVFTSRNLTFFM